MKTLLLSLLIVASMASECIAQNSIIRKYGERGFTFVGGLTVASVTVGTAGTGYTSLPTVAFSAGSGAVQATGTSTLKVVGSVTVVSGGTGYTTGDTVHVTGGTFTTDFLGTVTASGGVVSAVAVTNAGVYTVPVTATGAATTKVTGSGADNLTITLGWGVGTVVVVTGGTDYLTAPTVAFSGGAGSSAAATATLNSQATVTDNFSAFIPLASTVVETITYPTSITLETTGRSGPYSGSQGIVGKTLAANIVYPIRGNSIKLTSGYGILIKR